MLEKSRNNSHNKNKDKSFINNTNLNTLLKKYKIDKNKYITNPSIIDYYDPNNIFENNNLTDLLCPICMNILKNPKCCSKNKVTHFFCKDCIDKHLEENESCPMCKNYFEYETNNNINKYLYRLCFKCIYNNKGCNKIIRYLEYFNHINKCEYKTNIFECQVENYNYNKKIFEKCSFKGNNNEIEEHFKKCAFTEYKCIFCNENILKINLKEHSEYNCKFSIINDEDNEEIYIGETDSGIKNGFGKCFDNDSGDKYEGEWQDDERCGYGICYYSDGNKYIGDWESDQKEGIGIIFNPDGTRYEGEFSEDNPDGYGTIYHISGEIYKGQIKEGSRDGFGIDYDLDGEIYEGEWIDDKREGYGRIVSNNLEYEGFFNLMEKNILVIGK